MARKPIKREELVEKYLAIYQSMTSAKQPDMACSILVAAFLENALMALLNDFLVQDGDITPRLFKNSRPLGGFANCQDVAFSLGLITKRMHKNLEIIGTIRNTFAHGHELLTFDSGKKNKNDPDSIKEFCESLLYPTCPYLWDGKVITGEPKRKPSAREKFTYISAVLFRRIHETTVKRCQACDEW